MRRVLVANRGEIAVRIIRALFDEGIQSVLVASEADRNSLAARLADEVVVIGPASATDSYLSVERVVQAAINSGCDALHPGYGFLSERPTLVEACEQNGITFIGPSAEVMRESGDKLRARQMADAVGIPVGKGTAGLTSLEEAVAAADELADYPLLLKASAGGGGRGMTIVRTADDLREGFTRSSNEAERAFGDGTVFLEPYIEKARHIEVQLLADTHGNVRHLGERDCSAQRRYQKVVEEAPCVGLSADLIERIREAAVRLAKGLNYVGAATCEFLVDVERENFVFLEVNARVQVEHPVSEAISGIDVIREQIRIARGEVISFEQDELVLDGHAIECRINAENASTGFMPTPGTVTEWTIPQGDGVRVDTYMHDGAVVPPFYDSLIAKIIVHAPTRKLAIEKMARVLERSRVSGISTTIDVQLAIMNDEVFRSEPITTKWLEDAFLPTFNV